MKAAPILYEKLFLQGERFVVEVEVVSVKDFRRYPDGVKYGLLCLDQETGRRVLLDNHYPKGHHLHISGVESVYLFQGVDQLVEDFKAVVFLEMGIRL